MGHILLGLCVVVLLVVGTEAQKQKDEACPEVKEPIRFIFGGNYPPYDYLVDTPDWETQTGFGVEFAKKLCERNDLDCELVRHDYEECWTTQNYPGRGLYGGGFHACSTYTHTHLRNASFDFGHAYTLRQPAGLLTRLDSKGKPVVSPESDLKGVKVALVGGWATNVASLRYVTNDCTKKSFSGYIPNIPVDAHSGPDAAIQALLDGEVDLVYTYADILDARRHCSHGGCNKSLYDPSHLGKKYAWIHTGITEYQANGTTLVMAPKGSPLTALLNPMMEEFMASEEYTNLCEAYADMGIQCFSNAYSGTHAIPWWSMPDRVRTEACRSKANPEECLSCSSGYCPCGL